MNARQFDGLAETISSAANRRGVLGLLGGGVVAALRGRGVARAHHKPGHCPKSRCKGRVPSEGACEHCDLAPGTGCSCVLSVEGCQTCVDENTCGVPCQSSAECVGSLGQGA